MLLCLYEWIDVDITRKTIMFDFSMSTRCYGHVCISPRVCCAFASVIRFAAHTNTRWLPRCMYDARYIVRPARTTQWYTNGRRAKPTLIRTATTLPSCVYSKGRLPLSSVGTSIIYSSKGDYRCTSRELPFSTTSNFRASRTSRLKVLSLEGACQEYDNISIIYCLSSYTPILVCKIMYTVCQGHF